MAARKDLFNLIITVDDSHKYTIELGQEPEWQKRHKRHLKRAKFVDLVPRERGCLLRPIRVQVGGPRELEFYMTTVGTLDDGDQVTTYSIGWKDRHLGVCEVCTVFPSGAIVMHGCRREDA